MLECYFGSVAFKQLAIYIIPSTFSANKSFLIETYYIPAMYMDGIISQALFPILISISLAAAPRSMPDMVTIVPPKIGPEVGYIDL